MNVMQPSLHVGEVREPHFLIETNYWNSNTSVCCGREIWIAGSWQLNQAFVETPLSCPKQSANGWTWTNLDWRSSWHNQNWRRGKSSETLFTARRRRWISAHRWIKLSKTKKKKMCQSVKSAHSLAKVWWWAMCHHHHQHHQQQQQHLTAMMSFGTKPTDGLKLEAHSATRCHSFALCANQNKPALCRWDCNTNRANTVLEGSGLQFLILPTHYY